MACLNSPRYRYVDFIVSPLRFGATSIGKYICKKSQITANK